MALPGANAHASFARGVVRLRLTNPEPGFLAAFDAGDRRIVEKGPAAWRQAIERRAANDDVSRRLRDAFDPARILNRGILGEETP
jgi:FAD/FMN-containing dehydrogenase